MTLLPPGVKYGEIQEWSRLPVILILVRSFALTEIQSKEQFTEGTFIVSWKKNIEMHY